MVEQGEEVEQVELEDLKTDSQILFPDVGDLNVSVFVGLCLHTV